MHAPAVSLVLRAGAAAVLVAAACAQPQLPPGGPPDTAAPRLIGTAPDSGQVGVRIDEVVFRFDEVVSEVPRGTELARAVLVSPGDGRVSVDWKRNAIGVRPRGGWRPNTTYVVTLLPVMVDLRGNVRDSSTVLVFSTGDAMPATRVSGVVFDWMRAAPASRAFVEARAATDSTLQWTTEADSSGRFVLPFLTPGEYTVRALVDANRNHQFDPREHWDSARVSLRDSVSVELYTAFRDTVAPRLVSAAATDSMTVRVTMDRPFSPDPAHAPTVEVFGPDSARIGIARFMAWPMLTETRTREARARQAAADAADTSLATRERLRVARQDSINLARAIADSIARDTTRRQPPPQSRRTPLVLELGIELSAPLAPGSSYSVRVAATGLFGTRRVTERAFVTQRRAPGGEVSKSPTPAHTPR